MIVVNWNYDVPLSTHYITLIQELYYISNGLTKFLQVLGFALKKDLCIKKSGQNRWEIDVKHALPIYQNTYS